MKKKIIWLIVICLMVASLVQVSCVSTEETGVALPDEEIERAIEEYDEAIRLNPNDAIAYKNRGTAYRNLGQFERAIEDYAEAIRLNPNDAIAYYSRGTDYCNLGQFERGIKDYTEAIHLNPDDVDAYYNRGLAYKLQDKKAEAVADFEKFIDLIDNPQWIETARKQIEELSK